MRARDEEILDRVVVLGGPWFMAVEGFAGPLARRPEVADVLTQLPRGSLGMVALDPELRRLLPAKAFRLIFYLFELSELEALGERIAARVVSSVR